MNTSEKDVLTDHSIILIIDYLLPGSDENATKFHSLRVDKSVDRRCGDWSDFGPIGTDYFGHNSNDWSGIDQSNLSTGRLIPSDEFAPIAASDDDRSDDIVVVGSYSRPSYVLQAGCYLWPGRYTPQSANVGKKPDAF